MKRLGWCAVAVAAGVMLTACGGGGSAGTDPYSRSVDPGLMTRQVSLGNDRPASTTTPESAPARSLKLSVQINGTAVAADGSGQFSMKPGDVIKLVPSEESTWDATGAPSGALSAVNADIDSMKWSAQILNGTTAAAVLSIKAIAKSDTAVSQTAVINVAAGSGQNN